MVRLGSLNKRSKSQRWTQSDKEELSLVNLPRNATGSTESRTQHRGKSTAHKEMLQSNDRCRNMVITLDPHASFMSSLGNISFNGSSSGSLGLPYDDGDKPNKALTAEQSVTETESYQTGVNSSIVTPQSFDEMLTKLSGDSHESACPPTPSRRRFGIRRHLENIEETPEFNSPQKKRSPFRARLPWTGAATPTSPIRRTKSSPVSRPRVVKLHPDQDQTKCPPPSVVRRCQSTGDPPTADRVPVLVSATRGAPMRRRSSMGNPFPVQQGSHPQQQAGGSFSPPASQEQATSQTSSLKEPALLLSPLRRRNSIGSPVALQKGNRTHRRVLSGQQSTPATWTHSCSSPISNKHQKGISDNRGKRLRQRTTTPPKLCSYYRLEKDECPILTPTSRTTTTQPMTPQSRLSDLKLSQILAGPQLGPCCDESSVDEKFALENQETELLKLALEMSLSETEAARSVCFNSSALTLSSAYNSFVGIEESDTESILELIRALECSDHT